MLVALLLSLALGQDESGSIDEHIRPVRDVRAFRAGGRSGPGLAFFEFAPASGAGLPFAVNLCDTLQASEKVGNWWCLNGDGTMASGSQVTLTTTGTPTDGSSVVCPNGPDCGTLSARRYTSAQNHQEPSNAAFPASDFTVCKMLSLDSFSNVQLAAFGTGGSPGTAVVLPFELQPSGAIISYVSNGVAFSSITGGSLTVGAEHLLCYSYDRVGNGTSVATLYVDGASVATSSAQALAHALSSVWTTNGAAGAASAGPHRTFGQFVTYSLLDATAMARIARAVLADTPTGAKGEAMTFTRASTKFCASSDGTGSDLPSGRPCITTSGISVESSRTSPLLRSRELNNVAWSDVGAPTTTGDNAVNRNGTLTADTIQDNSAAAFEGRQQTVTVTAATAYVLSCALKAGTATTARLSNDGTTCDFTGLSSSTWTVASCADASSSGVATVQQVLVGNATTVTGTIVVGGCWLEAGTYATSEIVATSAAATRAGESASVTLSVGVGPSACLAASAAWPSTSVGAVNFLGLGTAGAGNNMVLYRTSDTAAGYQIGTTTTAPVVSSMSTTFHRSILSDNAGTRAASWDGTPATAPAASMSGAQTTVWIGNFGGSIPTDGVVRLVQIDPNPSRCR